MPSFLLLDGASAMKKKADYTAYNRYGIQEESAKAHVRNLVKNRGDKVRRKKTKAAITETKNRAFRNLYASEDDSEGERDVMRSAALHAGIGGAAIGLPVAAMGVPIVAGLGARSVYRIPKKMRAIKKAYTPKGKKDMAAHVIDNATDIGKALYKATGKRGMALKALGLGTVVAMGATAGLGAGVGGAIGKYRNYEHRRKHSTYKQDFRKHASEELVRLPTHNNPTYEALLEAQRTHRGNALALEQAKRRIYLAEPVEYQALDGPQLGWPGTAAVVGGNAMALAAIPTSLAALGLGAYAQSQSDNLPWRKISTSMTDEAVEKVRRSILIKRLLAGVGVAGALGAIVAGGTAAGMPMGLARHRHHQRLAERKVHAPERNYIINKGLRSAAAE